MSEPTPRWRVLITPRSLDLSEPTVVELLNDRDWDIVRVVGPLPSPRLADAWAECEAAILGLDEADAMAIDGAPRLRAISRYGVGYDNVDIAAARQRSIIVTTTPGAIEASVAELAIGLIIALSRDFGTVLSREPAFGSAPPGRELAGSCLGIIGMGRVGRHVAQRGRAFDMRILYVDPMRLDADTEASLGLEYAPLDDLLGAADVVSLHCSLTADTRGLLGRAELARLRPGALLVNTARGALLDEAALADGLRSGAIGGAALDVRAFEHDAPDDPLRSVPNVLFTPHIGSRTRQAGKRMARMAIENLIAVRKGVRPPGVIVA